MQIGKTTGSWRVRRFLRKERAIFLVDPCLAARRKTKRPIPLANATKVLVLDEPQWQQLLRDTELGDEIEATLVIEPSPPAYYLESYRKDEGTSAQRRRLVRKMLTVPDDLEAIRKVKKEVTAWLWKHPDDGEVLGAGESLYMYELGVIELERMKREKEPDNNK